MSFSTASHERERPTDYMPSKSGIVGLLACCLGRRRGADLSDLAALSVSVRADKAGLMLTDYQTIQNAPRANGKLNPDTFVMRRGYLQDAAFTVVLEGNRALLEEVEAALENPVFVPYLGRRSCLPTRPLLRYPVSERSPLDLLTYLPDLSGGGGERLGFIEPGQGDSLPAPFPLDDQPAPGRKFRRRYVQPMTFTTLAEEAL